MPTFKAFTISLRHVIVITVMCCPMPNLLVSFSPPLRDSKGRDCKSKQIHITVICVVLCLGLQESKQSHNGAYTLKAMH